MTAARAASGWHQVTFWCRDWRAAEQAAVTHVGPPLNHAEQAGTVTGWWFVRKGPSWRLRARAADGREAETTALASQLMTALTRQDTILSWAASVYEPEIHAFGGNDAMTAGHVLFHADSSHLLRHLGRAGPGLRRELGLLLPAILMRAAGQDWYEQGDIWLRAAAHRRPRHSGPAVPGPATADAVRQLITAGHDAVGGPLRAAPAWPSAWQQAGQELAGLAGRGRLTRGLRAVLAHHVLFAWNRLGIPAAQQYFLAVAAGHVVFQQTAPGDRHAVTCRTTVNAVTSHTAAPAARDAAQLRHALADHIARLGTFQTPLVQAAFRAVPRHLFLPGTSLEDAYAPRVVITKRAADGTPVSSASSPNIVAAMLEQLDARPGHRILEIGTGTGINAALLAELAGPGGHVTTIDIDEDIVTAARRNLDSAGYRHQVTVLCADGADGDPGGGTAYDRIIATAGAWDLPAAWWQQLLPDGRLVVPVVLHGSGLTRSLAFDYARAGQMISSSARVCGFVPMRGTAAAQGPRTIRLAGDVTLSLDRADPADDNELAQALTFPAYRHWTGITVGDREPVAHLDLWLATTGSPFARISAGQHARDSQLADPALRWAGAALHDGAAIAYLTARPAAPSGQSELGIVAHGPRSTQLADDTAALLHQWSSSRPAQPRITAQPAGTAGDHAPPGFRISRPATTLTITW